MEINETKGFETGEELVEVASKGTGMSLGAKIAIVAGTVLTGGAVLAVIKGRKKLEQKTVENLKKKGYVIYREEELSEDNI